jgi:ethanolamine utilization protein EutL
MHKLVDLWPTLLACRRIDAVNEQLAAALQLDTARHTSIALLTCDQDDALYVALDACTKAARVDVVFGASLYAGSKHGPGPLSGEVLGIIAAANPSEVEEGIVAAMSTLREVRFQQLPGDVLGGAGMPAFLAHVVTETGTYLSAQANIAAGDPLAYLIAPPLEAVFAVDAALKAAPVRMAKWLPPPSETNFAGAYLVGELADLHAARDAFVGAIADVAAAPKRDARRPQRDRR